MAINADTQVIQGEAGAGRQMPPRRSWARMRPFVIRVASILAVAHLYVGLRLLPALPVDLAVQILGGVLLAVSSVLIPFGTLAQVFVARQPLSDRLVWAGALTMGWFSSLFVFTLVRDVAFLVPGAAAWKVESAGAVVAAATLTTLVGYVNARRLAKVVRVDVALDGLAPELDGFTIAQISDIHVGATIKNGYVRNIVERVNALAPDMVALTGDAVDGDVQRLRSDTAPLGDLKARHGTFFVTGNHEYYSGAQQWIAEFQRLGMRTLANEHVVIDHDGAPLVIAGVNDYAAGHVDPSQRSDPRAAAAGSPDGVLKILLAHQPRSAAEAVQAGFDLQLSGHTHGGQFWPWNHAVRMQQPYTAGLHRLGRMWVYTSRGTGYWGPPKRFGAPSEITLIRLVAKANGVGGTDHD